ncbi:MAG: hypothetical protein ACRENE_25695 [Polyangiaceae bacterium]
MMGAAAQAGAHRGLDAREQVALARLVERAAIERQAATIEYDSAARVGAAGVDAQERPDLIVACEVGVGAIEWEPRLEDLVRRAAKGLVLVTDNPHRLAGNTSARRDDRLDVARLLWQLGRIRDCVYLVFPHLVESLAAPTGWIVAPDLARAPANTLVRRAAHLLGYVVDTTPRTPQARRRRRLAVAS